MTKNYLDYFDVFGIHYFFPFDGELKYQTKLGGIITLLTLFFALAMSYVLGEEIIYKTNPKDLFTVQVDEVARNMTFRVSTGFLFVDDTSSYIDNYERYIRFNAFYHNLINTDGTFQYIHKNPEPLKLRLCNSSDFPEEVAYQYDIMALDNAICIDERAQDLGGSFANDYSKFISIDIKPCVNQTDSAIICASEDEINGMFKSGKFAISMHHNELQYNASDFSKPIKQFILEDNYRFNSTFCKHYTYYFQEFQVNTDQGIFWKDFYLENFYRFDYSKSEFTQNLDSKFSDTCFFDFRIFSSINTVTHHRYYMKGTDVIAQLGGILKMYLLAGELLFYFLYNKRMQESIITKLFYLTKDDIENNKPIIDTKSNISPTNKIRIINFDNSSKLKKLGGQDVSSDKLLHEIKIQQNFSKEVNIKQSVNQNVLKKVKNKNFPLIIVTKNKPKIEINKPIIVENKFDLNSPFNTKSKRRILKIFSYSEYLYLLTCNCFIYKKLREKNNKFEALKVLSYKYTDILNIIHTFQEFKKLKILMFNKKQLSIFNLIQPPTYPYKEHSNSIFTNKLNFEMNKEAQKIKAIEFLNMNDQLLKDDIINRRLLKLYKNN